MTTIPATEAKNKFGELLDQIKIEPVEIAKNGRKVAVILSIEQYEQLKPEKENMNFDSLRAWREKNPPKEASPIIDEEDYYKQWL